MLYAYGCMIMCFLTEKGIFTYFLWKRPKALYTIQSLHSHAILSYQLQYMAV